MRVKTIADEAYVTALFPKKTAEGAPFRAFDHQCADLPKLFDAKYFALFWEMALGKTSEIATELKARGEFMEAGLEKPDLASAYAAARALIATPLSVVGGFAAELRNALDPKFWEVVEVVGSAKQKHDALASAIAACVDRRVAVVTNHDTVRTMTAELFAYSPDYFVIDESQVIKNRAAKLTKAAHKLGAATRYRRILSGTPEPLDQTDLWAQYYFLHPSILGPNFFAFRNAHCQMGGFKGKKVVGTLDVPGLRAKIAPHTSRRLKKDCLDTPGVLFAPRRVPLSDDAARAYLDLRRESVAFFAENKTCSVSTTIARVLRLQQVTSGFLVPDAEPGTDSGSNADGLPVRKPVFFRDNAKLDALVEVLAEAPDRKALVWCRWTPEVDAVAYRLRAEGKEVYVVDGRVTGPQRTANVAAFTKAGPEAVFVAQIRAGGVGLNLQTASLEVFMSQTWSDAERRQAIDRADRPGQTREVVVVDLFATLPGARNTIDSTIYAACLAKRDLAALILDDPEAAL